MADTNRRDFIKFMALLAAGASALPSQIEAYEKYYDANTPLTAKQFVAIDQIAVCGLATTSTRVRFELFHQGRVEVQFALNAFGGIVRWLTPPDGKIVGDATDLKWRLSLLDGEDDYRAGDDWVRHLLDASLSYIEEGGRRQNLSLTRPTGRLV